MRMRRMLLLCLLPSVAWAQAPAGGGGLPPNVPIPPEKSIPMDQALEAAQAALAACAARNSPATVEVMDLNQNPKVLLSADGARSNSFEPARRKAYTVLKKGMSSGAFAKRIGSPPVNMVIEGDPNLRASAGGVPILRGGILIGALAVSSPTGQETDELCAQAGVAKFRF
jgi:uncharacterized protein GlcG (DUF336 family)